MLTSFGLRYFAWVSQKHGNHKFQPQTMIIYLTGFFLFYFYTFTDKKIRTNWKAMMPDKKQKQSSYSHINPNDSSIYSGVTLPSNAGTLTKTEVKEPTKNHDLLRNSFMSKEDPIKEVESFGVREIPVTKETAKVLGKEVLQFHASKGNSIFPSYLHHMKPFYRSQNGSEMITRQKFPTTNAWLLYSCVFFRTTDH